MKQNVVRVCFMHLVLLFACACAAGADGRPDKPNVVLLLTDDVGWQDLKCYDIDEASPYETPNLDALAKQGVMFWQAYSPAPTCTPSRVAIISGEHPARSGVTHVSGNKPPAPHHIHGWSMMAPWYSSNMHPDTVTFPQLLQKNGYYTGHAGKWHITRHYPKSVRYGFGFDYTTSDRGARSSMKDRFKTFATTDKRDKYRLDENGFPFHQNNVDALAFLGLAAEKKKPFFLYYATWLVHGPWHTRSEALLKKYCKKLSIDYPVDPKDEILKKKSPIYCAMVEELDYYLGQILDHLRKTDDPRWPGHKLIENTYVIFTSDNGGVLGHDEYVTSNKPLQKGKISAMEGGTRVPMIVVGPGIPKGVQSHVMVNGLDLYPTIMDWTCTEIPASKHLDGLNIAPLFRGNPQDARLVKDENNKVRDTMVWHFPNADALESTIRVGGYKLIRNYSVHDTKWDTPPYELYQLYKTRNGKTVRVDIEESNNLVTSMPEKTMEMRRRLHESLTEMKAEYPHINPLCPRVLGREEVCKALSHAFKGDTIEVTYEERGNKVVRVDLIYLADPKVGWLKVGGEILPGFRARARMPTGATHCFVNLIDNKNFLVSYPDYLDKKRPWPKNASERALQIK